VDVHKEQRNTHIRLYLISKTVDYESTNVKFFLHVLLLLLLNLLTSLYPILHSLHWLKITVRIEYNTHSSMEYKLLMLTYIVLKTIKPSHHRFFVLVLFIIFTLAASSGKCNTSGVHPSVCHIFFLTRIMTPSYRRCCNVYEMCKLVGDACWLGGRM